MSKRLLVVILTVMTITAHAQEPQTRQEPRRPALASRSAAEVRAASRTSASSKWFEEHRIPGSDLVAGSSMGGLIGGAFATGMDAAELEHLLETLNWDEMFGSSDYGFKNIRRKADGRDYPSRLEFGLKHGITPPAALNNGEQVDLLVGRIAAPYYAAATFDELPTPFRAVAVDLRTATPVILDRGPLDRAMRATMSLPLIFPPVELGGHVLVDGGLMDNVPADIAKAMGADIVIAINVGDLSDLKKIDYSLVGLAGETLDAMMRANTKAGMKAADIVIDVPLENFGSLDWRRTPEIIAAGYQAAEASKGTRCRRSRSAKQNTTAGRRYETPAAGPPCRFRSSRESKDSSKTTAPASRNCSRRSSANRSTSGSCSGTSIRSGLDRYESITWRIVTDDAGGGGLLVSARPKTTGPPFLMLGLNLENVTSEEFRLSLAGQYLAYDVVGSGSELRIYGRAGSNPSVGFELYRPIGSTPLFLAPYADAQKETLDIISDNQILARYATSLSRVGFNVGVNLGTFSDLRVGGYIGRLTADVQIGDPSLPTLSGTENEVDAVWRYDTQDSPVMPSRGTNAYTTLRHVLKAPEISAPTEMESPDNHLTQLSGEATKFWPLRRVDRLFVLGGFGTSFSNHVLLIDAYPLGQPFHLGAYSNGEVSGANYFVLTGGYFKQISRLPDFIGGPVYLGGWLENGDAFDYWSDAKWRTQASVGLVMDTLIGPVAVGASAGFDGRWRTYVSVGRVFGRMPSR